MDEATMEDGPKKRLTPPARCSLLLLNLLYLLSSFPDLPLLWPASCPAGHARGRRDNKERRDGRSQRGAARDGAAHSSYQYGGHYSHLEGVNFSRGDNDENCSHLPGRNAAREKIL